MKNTILSIASGSIILTSITIAGESLTQQAKATGKVNSVTATTITDPAVSLITHEILSPIITQSKRFNKFSRTRRPTNTVYEIVENTESATKEVRSFDIVRKPTILIFPTQPTAGEKKDVTNTLHEIKYLTASNEILIKQGDDWVTKQDHKFLSLLPKVITSDKVVANKQ